MTDSMKRVEEIKKRIYDERLWDSYNDHDEATTTIYNDLLSVIDTLTEENKKLKEDKESLEGKFAGLGQAMEDKGGSDE